MYVTGIGRTKFGALKEGIPELMYKSMSSALEDARIEEIADLDAIYVSNFIGGVLQNQLHLNSVVSSLLPGFSKPTIRVETACASGGSAVYQALISLSRFDKVLVVGVEKMSDVDSKEIIRALASAGDYTLDQKEGLIFPASYALIAQQHMLKYGTTHDDLSLVSLKNHNNANLNPLAHFYYKKVDLDSINSSPVLCTPFNLFDLCPISDGAAAIVLSKERKSDRDIEIVGSALATDSISLSQREELTTFPSAKIASKEVYAQAKTSPKELDVVEVHDCFTIAELVAMEDLGICKPGESKKWIRAGKTELNGEIPINTDGGLIGDGHPIGASGIAQIYEVVEQLRGEADARQVDGAKMGLTHNIGGVGGTAAIHILKS